MLKNTLRQKLWGNKRLTAIMSLGAAPFLCASGVTAVEFALIMPVLILLFMGVIEFAIIMYASGVLDGATVAAARAGRTGYPVNTTDAQRSAYVHKVLNDRIGGLLDTSQVMLASKASAGYGGITPVQACEEGQPCQENLGTARSQVVYTSSYPWHVLTPGLASLIGDADGVFYIASTAIVKNEPWDSTTPTDAPTPAPTATVIFGTPEPTTPAPTPGSTTPSPTGSPPPTSAPPSTTAPTAAPTPAPTIEVTEAPTPSPTPMPTTTVAPTSAPTAAPTSAPTSAPAPTTTAEPTAAPTAAPTPSPTHKAQKWG